MASVPLGEVSWERMIRAVEKVRERLLRASAALEKAGVPYAVVGGNAVAALVSRVDEAAVRNTPDVDLLIRRVDLDDATTALTQAGLVHCSVTGIKPRINGPQGRPRDAIHLVFAGEKASPEQLFPAPDATESETVGGFRVITLDALVRMKLTTFRLKDRMHVRDLLDVGLIDASWCDRLPPELAMRLRELLADPEG